MKAIDVLGNEGLTADFARLLMTELGADAKDIEDDWCWEDILERHADLIPAVMAWFCRVLKDGKDGKDTRARWLAAYALGHIGDTKAVPALRKALKDDRAAQVRRYAAHALGKIGGAKAVTALTRVLQEDEDAGVRQCALRALEKCQLGREK